MCGRRSTATITRPHPRLTAVLVGGYLIFAAWLLQEAQADPATSWMWMVFPEDFPTAASVLAYLRDLRTGIPPVLSLLEIASVWWTGDATLMTAVAYQAAMALAFLLPILFHRHTLFGVTVSFAIALVLLTSAVLIHPGNPQVYDVYFPLFTLLFIACRQRAREDRPRSETAWLAAAGFFLTMAELTRPFLFPIVIYAAALVCLRLRGGPRWRLAAFLIPLVVFSGGWHAHQAWRFSQITWTNHAGFNLIRAWPMVGDVPLAPETGSAPLGPERDPNINTQAHQDNSQRLVRAVLEFIWRNPATGVKHAIRRVQALVGTVRTSVYSHAPDHAVFRLYRPAVWVLSGLLLANLIGLGARVLRRPRDAARLLAAPRNLLVVVTAYSVVVLAVGDASEEARFLISLLPLLAAAARNPWSDA